MIQICPFNDHDEDFWDRAIKRRKAYLAGWKLLAEGESNESISDT